MAEPGESKVGDFRWTPKATTAAMALAAGHTRKAAAAAAIIGEATLYRWLAHPAFAAEVDRLSVLVDIAGRAERLRIARRAIRSKVHDDGTVTTERDLLDWLKFAQSETDGLKLGLTEALTVHVVYGSDPPAAAE